VGKRGDKPRFGGGKRKNRGSKSIINKIKVVPGVNRGPGHQGKLQALRSYGKRKNGFLNDKPAGCPALVREKVTLHIT